MKAIVYKGQGRKAWKTSSGARVLAIANARGDTTNAIKAAMDFGLIESGLKIVPLGLDVPFIDSSGGLSTLQGG
jgi:branched-chain amino acid transport system substrate-binding protein